MLKRLAMIWFFFPIFQGCPGKGQDLRVTDTDVQKPRIVKATFVSTDGRRSEFWLEVADTPEARAKGLMFRKDLAPDHGMVFVFPNEDIQTFYMKNTYIPLDMIFISNDFRVVGVIENARPLTTSILSVDAPSKYVVEVRANTAGPRGITRGARVSFDPPLEEVSR